MTKHRLHFLLFPEVLNAPRLCFRFLKNPAFSYYEFRLISIMPVLALWNRMGSSQGPGELRSPGRRSLQKDRSEPVRSIFFVDRN